MPNFVGSIWNNMTRYAPSAYAAIKQGAGMFGAGFGGIAEAWGGMSTAGKVAGVGMGLGGGWMGTNLIARGLGATVGTLGDLGGVAFGGPAENFQRGRSRGPIGL